MNDNPENLSAPKAEKPNRAQVIESLKKIQDFATHIKGQPLKPEQSFQLRVFEQTVNNTPLQNGVSQTENSFVSTETGQKFSQREGIPLNELIQITTERLGTEGLSLQEQKQLMQHIDILRASSKSFMSFPERIDPDQYKARIEQEAAMMSKIPGETRSHQELLAEADRILKDRIELVLPDDEAKIQDGSNSEVDSSPVRPDQAMILRPDNPLVPITKSDEVDSSPVRPDQAMILRPDNFGVINEDTNDYAVDHFPVEPEQAMVLRPDNPLVPLEKSDEVDSSPVRPDQAMILRPDGSMVKVDKQPTDSNENNNADSEDIKFATSITNATEAVDTMAHLGARRDVTESLRETRWGWPIDWIRKTGVRWLEKFHVVRRADRLRQANISNNTSQMTMAEVNGAAASINQLRADGQLEQRAVVERFNRGQLIGDETQFTAEGELKRLISQDIINNVVNNNIQNADQLRASLEQFVRNNLGNQTLITAGGTETVGQQLQRVFGANASEFGRIADYFATDLLEMGANIREHLAKHNKSLAEIDKQIEIKLGNARLANGGENQDWVDRAIAASRRIQSRTMAGERTILTTAGVILNPLVVGVVASLGYTALMQGSSILTRRAMMPIILGTAGVATVATGGIAPLLVGATAAGAIAMNRRFWELGQDGMQHTADRSIIGEKITAKQETPKNLLQRFANDFLDLNRRESLNRRRYDTVSAINLIEGGGNDPSGNVRRSVSELRKLDISEGQEANRNEIARRIAEIQTRLDFNFDGQLTFNNHTINTRKAALIDYENSTEANTKPTDLLIEKNKLKDVLSRGGMNKEQIDLLIGAERVIMSKYFIRNIEQQNRAFMKYRLLNSAGAGVFGAGVGILGGLFAQEVVTAASRVAQPILENVVNNINTNPLLLWAMNTVRTISQGRTIRENLFNTGPSVEQQNTGITRQALRDLFSRPGTLQVDKDLYLNVDGNSEIRNASFSSIGNYAEAANENNISVDSTSRILKTPPLRVEGESIIMSGKPDLVNDPNVDPRIRELLKGWSTETNIPDSNESTIKYNVERELTDAISNNRVAGFAQGNLEVSVGDPANPSIRPDGQISLRLLRDHLEDPSIRMENGKVSPEFEDARKFAVHIFGKAQLIDGRPSVTIDPTLPGSPPYLGPDGQMTREWLDIKNELIKNQWDVREVIVDGNPQLQIVQHTNWELQPTVATKFTPPIIAGPMESFVTPISAVPRHALSSMEKNHQDSNSESPLLQEGIPPITEDTGNKSKVRRFGRGMSKKFKKGFEAFNDGMNKGTEAVDKAFGNKTPQREKTDERTQEENPSDLEPTRNDSRVQRVYDVVNDRMNAGLAAVDRAFSKSESAGTSSDELIELPIAPSSTVSSTDPGVDNTVDNRLNSGLEKVDDLRNSTESRSLPINDTVNQISSNVNALLNTGTERIDQVKANLEANLNSALSQINSVLTVGALNAISGIDYAFRPEVQEQLNRDILKLDADIQAKWQQLATLLAQMRAKKNNTAVTPPPIENNIPEELAVEKPQGTEITPTENISAEILTSEPKTTKFTLPELSTELPTELTQTDLPPEQINQLKQLLFLNNMVINLSQKPNYDGSDFVHLQTQIMQAMDRLGSNTNNSWSYSDKDGLTIKDKHYTAAEFNDLRNQFIDINFAKLPGGAKLENYRDMVVPRSFNIGNMWREFGAKSFFKNLGLAALQEQIKAEELRYAPAVLRWGDEVQQKWIIDKIQQNIPQI